MRRKRLIWQIYPSYIVIILLTLSFVGWSASYSFTQFHREQLPEILLGKARLLSLQVKPLLQTLQHEQLDWMLKDWGPQLGTHLTVTLPDGSVVADSDEVISELKSIKGNTEIRQALKGDVGQSRGYDHAMMQNAFKLAVPVHHDEELIGVLRLNYPLKKMEDSIGHMYQKIATGSIGVILLALVVNLFVTRRITRPLTEIKKGAEMFARGELERRLPIYHNEEIGGLAKALNEMAVQLADRLRTVIEQRNEQEAVFSSMVEGVLAVDKEEKILDLNVAAASLFGVRMHEVRGKSLQEVIRNPDLNLFVNEVFEKKKAVEGNITIHKNGGIFLQAHGNLLRSVDGQSFGVLIVLNDVTSLRRLERVRKDFVANVSHELRTPITTIKGFVETLMDGAVDDPPQARRFLNIVSNHVERLMHIIEDLLSLSRIEQNAERDEVLLEEHNLLDVLAPAILTCENQAQGKEIAIQLTCQDGLKCQCNRQLFEQAIVNLVDNAIKYSDNGKPIYVEATQTSINTTIKVIDNGIGINAEDIPRLFERFYRVDKSRSREVGGTGLGLAIVKYIVQAHKGRVTVESVPGHGSTFTITVPNQ